MTAETLGPYKLGPYDQDTWGIVTGDARELARAIPDESVDLIFTDPVYDRIEDYRWLAETAARVLKPDRACLVWCSKPKQNKARSAMEDAGLAYVYTLDYTVIAKSYRLMFYHVFCWTTPCLWMAKGRSLPRYWIPDTVISQNGTNGQHKWNKNPEAIITWLDAFSKPGAIVADFFCGGGTVPAVCKQLNRRWLAFEIDPDTAATARQRVQQTQPPLPGLVVQQIELEFAEVAQ